MALILLVEDEKLLRWALTEQLNRVGHVVHAAALLEEAAELLKQHQPDVMLLDLSLPDGHGLDFYERHRSRLEDTVTIVMTAVGQVDDAVRAMKLGALDFLSKPVDQQDLIGLIERSVSVRSERLEVEAARQSRERDLSVELIVESPAARKVLQILEEVARSEVDTLLLQGESGTGKNVLARHVHAVSSRRKRPLLEVSCAAIPDTLIESELLGHERGAFTDAKTRRKGAFELADGGTVVLDEVGELKLELQAKLLHVLEERRLRRVGGSREVLVDLRVIALSNRDLAAMAREGGFRQDLLYRLNVFPVTLPSLRERSEDILPLARHFLATLQAKVGRQFEGLTREAENRLLAYSWPGNIRELRNVIERALIVERTPRVQPESLILDQAGVAVSRAETAESSFADGEIVPLEQMEHELVARAMQAGGGNQTRAAELLGISRDQLRYRLKKFNLDEPDPG
jgi:DNA-binding NtrC family response regulator